MFSVLVLAAKIRIRPEVDLLRDHAHPLNQSGLQNNWFDRVFVDEVVDRDYVNIYTWLAEVTRQCMHHAFASNTYDITSWLG